MKKTDQTTTTAVKTNVNKTYSQAVNCIIRTSMLEAHSSCAYNGCGCCCTYGYCYCFLFASARFQRPSKKLLAIFFFVLRCRQKTGLPNTVTTTVLLRWGDQMMYVQSCVCLSAAKTKTQKEITTTTTTKWQLTAITLLLMTKTVAIMHTHYYIVGEGCRHNLHTHVHARSESGA